MSVAGEARTIPLELLASAVGGKLWVILKVGFPLSLSLSA